MNEWVKFCGMLMCAMLASSGLWAYLSNGNERKNVTRDMLIGLGHDRILYLGMQYIDLGHITKDEYENLYDYLYKPYETMGGNGSAKRIMQEVNKLPIVKSKHEVKNHEPKA